MGFELRYGLMNKLGDFLHFLIFYFLNKNDFFSRPVYGNCEFTKNLTCIDIHNLQSFLLTLKKYFQFFYKRLILKFKFFEHLF